MNLLPGNILATANGYNRIFTLLPKEKHMEFTRFIQDNIELAMRFQSGEMCVLQSSDGRFIVCNTPKDFNELRDCLIALNNLG